ncbi:MAG: dihydrofolate reductase family protein [Actinomycetes bacterium]
MSTVASLVVGRDGSTSKDNSSNGVSSDADRSAFLARRRKVDCILIGGNTARHEPYKQTPVPLVIISKSTINPVAGNDLSHLWNMSAAQALAKAKSIFGERILIEAGTSIIFELIEQGLIDQLDLSVTPVIGGDHQIDWQGLLSKFAHHTLTSVDGTDFYSAHN